MCKMKMFEFDVHIAQSGWMVDDKEAYITIWVICSFNEITIIELDLWFNTVVIAFQYLKN